MRCRQAARRLRVRHRPRSPTSPTTRSNGAPRDARHDRQCHGRAVRYLAGRYYSQHHDRRDHHHRRRRARQLLGCLPAVRQEHPAQLRHRHRHRHRQRQHRAGQRDGKRDRRDTLDTDRQRRRRWHGQWLTRHARSERQCHRRAVRYLAGGPQSQHHHRRGRRRPPRCRRAATPSSISCATRTPRPTAPPPPTLSPSPPASSRRRPAELRWLAHRSTPIANVAAGGTVNGSPATLGAGGNATVAQSGTWPPGITLNTTTGAVTTTAAVPPGSYSITYQLCDRSTPPNCATATDTVTVSASIVPAAQTGTAVAGTASTPIANVATGGTVNGSAGDSRCRAAMPPSRSPAPGRQASLSTPRPVRSRPPPRCLPAAIRSSISCATRTPRRTAPPPLTPSPSTPASCRSARREAPSPAHPPHRSPISPRVAPSMAHPPRSARAAMRRLRSPVPGRQGLLSTPPPVRSRPPPQSRRAPIRLFISCATGTPRPTAPPPPTPSASTPTSSR